MNQVKRTPGEKRPSVQREVASVLDRYRAARDVDQAELGDEVEGKLRTIEAGVQRTRAGLRSVG